MTVEESFGGRCSPALRVMEMIFLLRPAAAVMAIT